MDLLKVEFKGDGLRLYYEGLESAGGVESISDKTVYKRWQPHPDLKATVEPLKEALLKNTGAARALELSNVKTQKATDVLKQMASSLGIASIQKLDNGNFKVTGSFSYNNPVGCHAMITPSDTINGAEIWSALEAEVLEYVDGKSAQLSLELVA